MGIDKFFISLFGAGDWVEGGPGPESGRIESSNSRFSTDGNRPEKVVNP